MKHQSQPRHDGCGITCLAMVANVSYRKAFKAIFGKNVRYSHNVDIDQISKALKKFGFKTKVSSSFKNYKTAYAVILGFWWCPSYSKSYGHFVVYHPKKDKFLDPGAYDEYYNATRRDRIVSLWRRSGRETLVVYK